MNDQIDPRLQQQIEAAGEEKEVEAIILIADTPNSSSQTDQRGPGGHVIDRVTRQLKEQPTQVRFMPNLGVIYVKGSGRLVKKLLEQAEVTSASASDADVTIPR